MSAADTVLALAMKMAAWWELNSSKVDLDLHAAEVCSAGERLLIVEEAPGRGLPWRGLNAGTGLTRSRCLHGTDCMTVAGWEYLQAGHSVACESSGAVTSCEGPALKEAPTQAGAIRVELPGRALIILGGSRFGDDACRAAATMAPQWALHAA